MEKSKQAESPFSRLCDVAVIVRDLERAIAFYQSLGIGPFEPTAATGVTDRKVYGKPSNAKLKGVRTQLGPVELLLVQPIEGESVQKEFLDTKGEGISKLGFEVDNLDREVAEMEKKGFKVISSGRFPNGGGFAYLDTRKVGGVILALEQK
ncbi:MAG: VOC family protein [Chloroflexi bacterium]|nr:VOC family protein [Chloroflexota bacterium]